MGIVYAEITLRNTGDVTNVRRGIIKEPEIRQTRVKALVDTGAATMIINETIRQQLGLELETEDIFEVELADGSKQKYVYTEPVQIQWKNRKSICRAVLIPSASEALLGAIPLEDMDLIINPSKQELTGAHGEEVVHKIK